MAKLRTSEFYDYLDEMNADSDEKANAKALLVGSLAAHASDEAWTRTMQRIKKELEEKRKKEEKTNV